MNIATLDVGGTAIKYCLMAGDELTHQGSVPTPNGGDPANGEAFLQAIEGILAELRQSADGQTVELDGLAMSLPGVIEVESRHLRTGGALLYNYDVDATAWGERFGLPIEIENDARCSARAEFAVGNLQGVKNGLVLAFGTGIGGGVIVNGEVHKGGHLYAGEASMVFANPPHDLGNMSDPSTFAAQCSTVALCGRVAAAKGIERCTGHDVLSWVEAGDEVATQVFTQVCDDLARQIHNVQCWLDPERIALGGGISQNPLFVESVRAAHERFTKALPFPFPLVEIVPCKFFNDANLIGAYQHFLYMQAKRAA